LIWFIILAPRASYEGDPAKMQIVVENPLMDLVTIEVLEDERLERSILFMMRTENY
jgi:hypothetical protein